jgi:hypothetical protein
VERGAKEPSKHVPFRDHVMSGTHDWTNAAMLAGGGVVLLAVLALARRVPAFRRRSGAVALASASFALLLPGLFTGVLDWGRRLAWEPGPQNNEIQSRLEIFGHPDVQLADHLVNRGWVEGQQRWCILNLGPRLKDQGLLAPDASPARTHEAIRFLLLGVPASMDELEGHAELKAALRQPGALAQIRHDLRRTMPPHQQARMEIERQVVRRHAAFHRAALERNPDDATVLGHLGARLFNFVPEARPEVLAAWRDHVRRHPESERLRELLLRAERMPPPPPRR